MLKSQTLALRASEIRAKLAEYAGAEGELGDEAKADIAKLRTEYTDVETRYAAAATAEDVRETETTESAESREFRELRSKVGLNKYIEAASEKRSVEGAELEFNQALKMGSHKFPLELLAPVEERAKTDTDTVTRPVRWLDRLFSVGAASRVGVTFESVPSGAASYPIITAGASGAQRGRAEAAAVAAWTVGATELKPTRNAVHALFSREDDLRNPGLQDALTRDLRMALVDAVDLVVFKGDSGANENTADITGLNTAANVVEEDISQANKVKGSNVLSAFASLIDGQHATTGSDLRTVLSVGAQRLWMSTLANTGASVDTTIAEFLKRAGIELSSRGGIDTETTAGKFGAFIGRGRGIEGAGVAAVWMDGMLIVDPYSGAKTGEIQLTMNTFWAFGLPRPSNFARLKFVA